MMEPHLTPSMYIVHRRPFRTALSLAALAFVVTFVWFGAASAGISDAVKFTTLKNGLQVLVLENHKAPVATFQVFYRVGSRNERMGKTGLSHLVEHLMFRGTKKVKPEEFSNIIQENGGMDNAFTAEDFTDYLEVINHRHLDVPISLEADRMANFDPKGFSSEKAVVEEERRMRTDDNPQDALAELTESQAFIAHPYHWPVIGWMHDVQSLTLQDALDYHARYYTPANALIVAVGDFDGEKVMKQIAESFSSIKGAPKPPGPSEVEPPQEGERRCILRHAADLPAFAETFHVPNYKSPDSFALEVTTDLLAGGKSSRLYRKLVEEKRMVVGIDANYDMTSFDPGLFWITAQMRPGVKTEDAIAEVDKELAELRDKPVGKEELQKAKNGEQASFVFGQDSIFNEALMLGTYQMLGDYRMVDKYLSGIDKVRPADIQRVVKKYLVQTNCTLGVLVPTGMLPHKAGGAMSHGPISHAPGLPMISREVAR
jgi:zinc protease